VTVRQQLGRRLLPVALLIGALISLGVPVTYYMVDVDEDDRAASANAQELAERLGHLLIDMPELWKYQAQKYRELLDEFVRHRGVAGIQVRDLSGETVQGYTYTPEPAPRWTEPVSTGTATLFINNQRMGSVAVAISQAPLVRTTVWIFVFSTTIGAGLSLLAYFYPISAARSLEARVNTLTETLAERSQQLDALRAVTEAIMREPNVRVVFTVVSQHATALTGAAAASVRLWDDAEQILIPVAWYGVGDWMRERVLRLGEGISGRAARRREGMIVNNYRTSPYAIPVVQEAGISAVLAEPLLYRERLLGVLTVAHREVGRIFTEEDRARLALFVAHTTIVMQQARPAILAAVPRAE
jgi:putative methionine-R-sulfoxide reductase with GAF domain